MHSSSAGRSSKARFMPPLGHYMLEKRMQCRAGKPASITHCSRLRQAGGSRVVSSEEHQALEREEFYFFFSCSFSIIVFRKARFTPCHFTGVGKCRGTGHRKGGGGVYLAVSWLLRPPATGEAQRRCARNEQSGCCLLLLSGTRGSQGLCRHQEI